jgi:hypothetical protein
LDDRFKDGKRPLNFEEIQMIVRDLGMGEVPTLDEKLWEILQGHLFGFVNAEHTRGLLQVICHIIDSKFVKN